MSGARGALAPVNLQRLLAAKAQGLLGDGYMENYEPTLRDMLAESAANAGRSMGLGDILAQRMREEAAIGADFIPGVGEAVGADDTKRAYDAGNYGEAALNGAATVAGMIPGGGDMAAGALKAGLMSLPLYHGSGRAGLTELAKSTRGALGPGVYATPADNIAKRYGDNVYELEDVPRDIHQGFGSRYGNSWDDDNARLLAAVEPEKREELKAIIDKMWDGDGYPMRARIAQMYGSEDKAQELYHRAGFEGIAGHADGPEVVLFKEQKVKQK